jgi:hypothetical protein
MRVFVDFSINPLLKVEGYRVVGTVEKRLVGPGEGVPGPVTRENGSFGPWEGVSGPVVRENRPLGPREGVPGPEK